MGVYHAGNVQAAVPTTSVVTIPIRAASQEEVARNQTHGQRHDGQDGNMGESAT